MAIYSYTIASTQLAPPQSVFVRASDDLSPLFGASPIAPIPVTMASGAVLHVVFVDSSNSLVRFAEVPSASDAISGSGFTVDTGNLPIRLVKNLVVRTASYLGLITSEHFDRPKFTAAVSAAVQPFVDMQQVLVGLPDAFDLDRAVGVQLDAVGVRVGRSRYVTRPLTDIYFSWDTPSLGWGQGSWKGPFDPNDGLTRLDDGTYRLLLRAVVVANSWNGTAVDANVALAGLFNGSITPGTLLFIQDNFDMTMTIGLAGQLPPAIFVALLNNNEIPLRPVGVGVHFQVTSVTSSPIFGWGVNNLNIGGWGIGSWAKPSVTIGG